MHLRVCIIHDRKFVASHPNLSFDPGEKKTSQKFASPFQNLECRILLSISGGSVSKISWSTDQLITWIWREKKTTKNSQQFRFFRLVTSAVKTDIFHKVEVAVMIFSEIWPGPVASLKKPPKKNLMFITHNQKRTPKTWQTLVVEKSSSNDTYG